LTFHYQFLSAFPFALRPSRFIKVSIFAFVEGMPKKPKYKQWKTLKWNTPSALSIGVLMLMFLFAYLEWSRPEVSSLSSSTEPNPISVKSEKPKVPASAQLVPLPNFDDDQRGVAPTENVQVIMQHMHDPKGKAIPY